MPKPKSSSPPSAHLYPEGGPGRQLKFRLKAGEVMVGGILGEIVRPSIVKYYEQAGFDFVYIEYEHVFFSPTDLADTVQAARDNGLPVIAKTPQLERAEVAKLLECGVVGIQLPRTESREELETLISYLKFPPNGTRAAAPGYGNSDTIIPEDHGAWLKEQDEETSLVVHIETKVGYERAEEIVSTPGVDMVYPEISQWRWDTRGTRSMPTCAGRWKKSWRSASNTMSPGAPPPPTWRTLNDGSPRAHSSSKPKTKKTSSSKAPRDWSTPIEDSRKNENLSTQRTQRAQRKDRSAPGRG